MLIVYIDSLGFPIRSYHERLQLVLLSYFLFQTLFYYQIALDKLSNTMLNKSDEKEYPCLIPDFRRKTSSFTTEDNLSCEYFIITLY